jgi:ABC-type transport system substrate-binding protein
MPDITNGRKTYTFTLRDDIYFHDDPCFPDGIGRKVTARDAVYSLKRLMSLPQGGFWVLEHKVVGLDDWRARFLATGDPGARATLFDEPVEGLEIVDEWTFRIHLLKPYPQLLWALTLSYGAILPREAVDMYGPEFARHPVGTGPFVLKEYSKKQLLKWIRNPKYRERYFPNLDRPDIEQPGYQDTLHAKWERERKLEPGDWETYVAPHLGKRMPLADEIVFFIIPEASTSWLEFLSGTVDRHGRIEKEQFDHVVVGAQVAEDAGSSPDERLTPEIRDRGIHLQIYDDPGITYLAFNMEDETVGGYSERPRNLRKALSLCIDREYLIATYLNGRGRAANMVIPPGVKGYNSNYWAPCGRYNPQRALELLREAGYHVSRTPSGDWITRESPTAEPLELTVEFRSATQAARDIARFYTICAREIGIRLRCNLQTFPEFLRREAEGKGQLYEANWTMDYPDAQNVLQLLYGPNRRPGVNYAAFQNDRYDRLYEQLQWLSDSDSKESALKSRIIQEMIEIIDEDCPWIYLYYYQEYILFHDWFSPSKPMPMTPKDHQYFTCDPQLRRVRVSAFNTIYWPPAIAVGILAAMILIAFAWKIIEHQRG